MMPPRKKGIPEIILTGKKKNTMHNTGTISGPAELLAVVCVSKHLSNCPKPFAIFIRCVRMCGGHVIYTFMYSFHILGIIIFGKHHIKL